MRSSQQVNHAARLGATPLMIASRQGHAEVVSELLYAGAAVEQAGVNGCTALFAASAMGNERVVAALLTVIYRTPQ